jgi:hypothetical protein
MRFPPPEVIASWPTPNYIDPETRGPALIVIESIFLSVSLACVGLRLYVRRGIMSAKVELDDWLMVAAEVGLFHCFATLGISLRRGLLRTHSPENELDLRHRRHHVRSPRV